MKTLITTFAFALMVFAFNVNPAMANAGTDTKHTLWAAAESPVDVFGENEKITEIDESDFAYRIEAWCGKNKNLREAICSKDGFEWIKKQFAGLTPLQKQQQDEDDWNAWILRQFAVYEHLDSDSRDVSDGRDVADSGEEGSTSAAGTDEQ